MGTKILNSFAYGVELTCSSFIAVYFYMVLGYLFIRGFDTFINDGWSKMMMMVAST